MPRLAEQLRDFWDRVEIVARGAERRRFDAARALEAGKPWEARYEALTLLEELPRSPLALALWADAAEATWLDHEAAEALTRLAKEVPFRADVWYRLALVHARLGQPDVAALERAVMAEEPRTAADAARLRLAEHDLASGDYARAERWLDQLTLGTRSSPDALALRAQLWLRAGQGQRARALRTRLPTPATLDGAGWLLFGQLCPEEDAEQAIAAFKRALLLDAAGSIDTIQNLLWEDAVPGLADGVRGLVEELGQATDPAWRASFAAVQGRRDEALLALSESAARHPAIYAERYRRAALEARSPEHVARAVRLSEQAGTPLDAELLALAQALETEDLPARVALLDTVHNQPWASELRQEAYRAWLFPADCAWSALLEELGRSCRNLSWLDGVRETEAIAVDLERPVRVAVLGEFNAGKSSFINALLGEAVARTGVLPTTTTVHRLAWAPERFARVQRRSDSQRQERVVPYSALSDVLAALPKQESPDVTLYAPLELLKRVEIIDTPGFNALEPTHALAARRALDDTHAVLWIFDASQPLKQSERTVLEELRARELPLFVLLNKIDRLPDAAALRDALVHVERGLAECQVQPEHAPLAFSARLALQGRLGDVDALERSQWANVERLIEGNLFARSAELRQRALLGRARRLAARLRRIAAERVRAASVEHAERVARWERLTQSVAQVRSRRLELERALETALSAELPELERVLLPVRRYANDAAAVHFVVQRTRALLAPALARAALAWLGDAADATLEPALRARFAAGAAALAPWLSGGRAPASEDPQPAAVPSAAARRQLAGSCAGELLAVLEEQTGCLPVLAADPDALRAEALLGALELGQH
ncbi:MAG TPA: dynamin family protein [Polyangiaceae bacterium]